MLKRVRDGKASFLPGVRVKLRARISKRELVSLSFSVYPCMVHTLLFSSAGVYSPREFGAVYARSNGIAWYSMSVR